MKFPAKNEPKETCAIEFLYCELARKLGLEIVETKYFDLSSTLSAFGMKRFDRERELRVPIHTLAGVLHADFRIPSSVDYLSFLRLTRYLTKNEEEVSKAFRHCVFNVIFHNRDDHPKNFAFLLDKKRNWRLSPAYDLTFSVGPGGEHQMDICGEGKAPGRIHLLKLAELAALDRKACERTIDQSI
jgi:serine/threonine-protein kinase HipA